MDKKAEISITYIIFFIIAIIVLIIVILVFREQVGILFGKIKGVITNVFAPLENIEFGK